MTIKEKINTLEKAGFTWFKIADILDITYDEVRYISQYGEEE